MSCRVLCYEIINGNVVEQGNPASRFHNYPGLLVGHVFNYHRQHLHHWRIDVYWMGAAYGKSIKPRGIFFVFDQSRPSPPEVSERFSLRYANEL